MDFGKLPHEALSGIDFTLRPSLPFNTSVLKGGALPQPKVYVGCPIWANKSWVGKVYPNTTKEAEMLGAYSKQFNTIELNVTHYQIPTHETIERWKYQTATNFRFCPKFPQIISHDKALYNAEALTATFCEQILGLQSKLGLAFLQLNPAFTPRQMLVLQQYLAQIPKEISLAVEFRHPNWFSNNLTWQRTLALLQKMNVATVITDTAGRRDVVHQGLSVPKVALRWVGNEHESDLPRIDAWVEQLKVWFAEGLEEFYLFVHVNDNNIAPELAHYWITQLNLVCNLNITPPKFLPKIVQGTLF